MRNIVTIKFGSHLYGTDTPSSDLDFKSVHLPDARDILLQRIAGSVGVKKEKLEGEKNLPSDVDDESYALHRYMDLLASGQTVALDMLFAPDSAIVSHGMFPIWWNICSNRRRLLSKKCVAFVGYCRQQANKYGIKGSRVSAAKKAMEFFQLSMDKLGPLAKVGEVNEYMVNIFDEHTFFERKETTPGHYEEYFVCCNRMVGFKNTLKEAAAIYKRIFDEYGERARRAQSNEGIDWKALSHAVRVGNEALELLTTGQITFPLPNAKHILSIKLGEIAYNPVAEEIEQLLAAVEEASKTSPLPDEVDRSFIDDFVCQAYRDVVELS